MTVTILRGDCRDVLRTLPAESVHCVVCSPPYWGLRDYGVPGQIGLEAGYAEYVDKIVEVFGDVRRVLRKDGTVWLNLGDSYHSGDRGGYRNDAHRWEKSELQRGNRGNAETIRPNRLPQVGLKDKDLCGIPWRVAFALQADGWYLRQDIIWSKPNPMPESVTDRCCKSHEYVFLLSKSPKYFFDNEAIKEDGAEPDRDRNDRIGGANGHLVRHSEGGMIGATAKRTKRSVWEIATAPFSEAHFATFPPALIEPCILAGCPKQCCAKCGAPWVRQTQSSYTPANHNGTSLGTISTSAKQDEREASTGNGAPGYRAKLNKRAETTGFSPSCSCNVYPTIPGTVLDPFFGAGTTGLVADRLGRNCIGIELNPTYASMAERRIRDDAPLFAEVS